MDNIFDKRHGHELLKKPQFFFGVLLIMSLLGYVVAKGGMVSGIGILAMPIVISYVYLIFAIPNTGIVGIYILNFVAIGIVRYVKGVPLGLTIDAQFLLIYMALFFKSFFHKIPWANAKNDLVLLAAIWYGYALVQLVNPEAASRVAWFYAMRSVSLYMLFTVPLIFILFHKKKDLELLFKIWAILSILATIKGIAQKMFGVDAFEQAWLDAGNASTHILFGKLRVFSFYSDAGQFGGAQGHAGVVFILLGLSQKRSRRLKIFYIIAGVLGLYGLMISGTRGAIAVPVMGFALYTVLQKKTKLVLLGAIMGISVLVFFKYTTIMQGNPTVRRMRTAFDPNNASLQVRLANQRKLKSYLASRPLGGGIGSAGNWGLRFTPHTFLANTATDSWYVMIWAEQGIIGLWLHLFILFYILTKSVYIIMFKLKDEEIKGMLSPLVCGFFGIMAASYGNGVLGQMPTGLLIYSSMGYLFLGKKLEAENLAIKAKEQIELAQVTK